MGRSTYYVTDQEIIIRGLEWLTRFKHFRDVDKGKAGSSPAVVYNRAWVQLIRRIKDYIKDDNDKLIKFYDYLKDSNFDSEIKEIILKNLKEEGKKRELVYFTDTETIKGRLDELQ